MYIQFFGFAFMRLSQRNAALRMYCIDTGAIAFMFNGGSSRDSTIHRIDTKICVLSFFLMKKGG